MGRKRAHEVDEYCQQQLKKEILSDVNEDDKEGPNDGNVNKREQKKKSKRRSSRHSTQDFNRLGEADDTKQRDFRVYRKKARGMDLSRAKEILDYEEAKKLILANKECGLRVLREKRHVTLPYHLIGGNVLKSCEFIAKMTVGKYRAKVGGVVVSIGSVRLASLPRVIDDQNVFHIDIFVTQVVFRPIVGHTYEARVTHIAEDFISALILEAISINTPVDAKIGVKLKALEVGDIIKVKHSDITIKRGICQLRGKFVRILRKGVSKIEVDDWSGQQITMAESSRMKFVDTDEEQ